MSDKLRIRHVDPNHLTPHPDNADLREMTGPARERLRRIIDRFGFVEPLIVSETSGYLIGGHRRREIAIADGHPEVPTVEIPDLTTDEERTLLVALNNAEAQGTFNFEALTSLLGPLEDTPLIEAAGFDFDQWQSIQLDVASNRLKAGREGETPAAADPGTKTRTQPGDRWQLGDHLLVVGDALTGDVYPTDPATMTFTDPPYNVNIEGGTPDHLRILNDAFSDAEDYAHFLLTALEHTTSHTTGAVYMCHATRMTVPVMAAWIHAGLHVSSTIAWVKDRFVLGRSDYHWQWEPILYGWPEGQGPDRHWFGDRAQGNVWEHATPKRNDQGRKGPSDVWRYQRPAASTSHPTMKPVALVEHALRNSSPPDGLVLDPFGGSGTTLIAAENIGRRAHLIEIDPRYADVIVARWESLEAANTAEKL